MQRQSLGGSPGSKLHQAHGGAKEQALLLDDAPNRSNKDLLVFSTSTSSSVSADDDHKASKPHRLSSPPPTAPHKSIHVIPVLTLLCFLILFLFSHSPSQSDLAQFNGFTKLPGKKRAGTMQIINRSQCRYFLRFKIYFLFFFSCFSFL
ncbi:unnamed protein product [Prunus armeniaca]